MSRRLFYWVHTTSRQPFETGIQRVVRRLWSTLGRHGIEVVPCGRDERSGLVEIVGRGTDAFDALLAGSGDRPLLFIPELTADLVVRGADPASMGRAYGMRTATLVHDVIPLKLREHYSAEAAAMFVAFYESLARADALLTTTRATADELAAFLGGRGLRVPPTEAVPLPSQFGDLPRVVEPPPGRRDGEALRLVTIVSWERRKNLLRLLRAVERAQRAVPIALTLVGRRGLDPAHDAEVDAQLATASGITVAGPMPDDALAALVAASHATVYPSWEEGFGLPIGESLWLGRACLCHDGSTMATIAPGGGTMMIDMTDETAIAGGLLDLAGRPELLARLSEEALRRPLDTWDDYAGRIVACLDSLA